MTRARDNLSSARKGVPSARYQMMALDSERQAPSSNSSTGIRPLGFFQEFRRPAFALEDINLDALERDTQLR
jgi:hypothetical protein